MGRKGWNRSRRRGTRYIREGVHPDLMVQGCLTLVSAGTSRELLIVNEKEGNELKNESKSEIIGLEKKFEEVEGVKVFPTFLHKVS